MPQPITSLTIESFRGIKQLHLNDLGAINLLVGKNNAGKSSVLEAIRFFEYPDSLGNVVNVSRMRERYFTRVVNPRMNHYDSFINLFNQKNDLYNITLQAVIDGEKTKIRINGDIEKRLVSPELYRKNMRVKKDQIAGEEEVFCFVGHQEVDNDTEKNIKEIMVHKYIDSYSISRSKDKSLIDCEYISPVDHLMNSNFGDIIKSGKKLEIVEALQIIEPKITGLELVDDIVYLQDANFKMLPLSVFGDGMKKIMMLAAGMIRAKNGILLIDELETGIHHSALVNLFAWFIRACCRYNVQVFATTHSLETVDEMLDAVKEYSDFGDSQEPLRLITLKKDDENGKTFSRTLTGSKAYTSRMDYRMELR